VVRENLHPGSENKIAEFSQSKHDGIGLTLYRGPFCLSGSKLAASKAMGFSMPFSSHCIRQQPTAIPLASTNMPHGLPYSTTCSLVALHRHAFNLLNAC